MEANKQKQRCKELKENKDRWYPAQMDKTITVNVERKVKPALR